MKYKLLQLCDILSNKNVCENLFNRFSCPINADVENFLKDKAVEYERKNLSRTYFVFYDDGDTHILVGYFSLALITISSELDMKCPFLMCPSKIFIVGDPINLATNILFGLL